MAQRMAILVKMQVTHISLPRFDAHKQPPDSSPETLDNIPDVDGVPESQDAQRPSLFLGAAVKVHTPVAVTRGVRGVGEGP